MKYAADFRSIARNALKGKWGIAVVAGLIASLLGAIGSSGPELNVELNDGNFNASLQIFGQDVVSSNAGFEFWPVIAGIATYVAIFAIVFGIALFILGSIVEVGYMKFNLDLVDGEEAKAGTLFDYLPQWKTMVAAGLLQTLYIFLWLLLFIIPGIVAAYRYAMTSFILAENPELTAGEAIDRSKELMNGNKWRLFCLHFSFIGWIILCGFTFGIGYLWLTPYEQAANAAFYRDITRPLAGEEHEIYLQETALGE